MDRHGHRYVHDVFDACAARQPDATAVVAAGTELTYRQLSRGANQLAQYLRSLGTVPDTRLGVGLDRGVEAVRALLAILKAGAAYLPLDPALPEVRLAQLRAEAGVRLVLTDRRNAAALAGTGARLLLVDELAPEIARHPATAPDPGLRPADLAYAIWTSGSTGQPKAVGVSHLSLACVCHEVSRAYRLTPADRVLQLASTAFDTSLEQILSTLLSGAALMLPGPGTPGPSELIRYLAEQRVTVADLTPAYWHELVAAAADRPPLESLRLLITGGDQADPADCRAALRMAPGARLVNAYGLTETTITSAVFDATGELRSVPTGALVPAGRPLRHARIYVLDSGRGRVPDGTAGEIYIGGCGVARGYLGQRGLTAERFGPDPLSTVPGARMYRTGDLGRWRPDHSLEVIGRMDRQVKVSGFRVEPAEVESVLAGHPDVGQVAVITRELPGGGRRLVAYYSQRAAQPASAPEAPDQRLRDFLAARLPSFMIPARFVTLDRLPLTPEGGIDRAALPLPATLPAPTALPALAGPASAPPASTASAAVLAGMRHVWGQVLRLPRVGLDDEFFALGGNSLLAAEMLARVRVMFGIDADQVRSLTRRLLRDPTLRGFAGATLAARAGTLQADGTDSPVDIGREARLDLPVRTAAGHPPGWRQPGAILLTGATGFLGVHLLRELLAATRARVFCLIRARGGESGRQRIEQAARRYAVGPLDLGRVEPLSGDLAQPGLGLPRATFEALAADIDVIHHAGALVNFIYPYSELRAANVTGTRELIRLAGLCRGIPIHFVSTMAVLAGFGCAGIRQVTEDTPLDHAEYLSIGYVESKFVAEEMLRSAARRGLPVAIYRPLDIVGDQRSGVWNTATEICALIRFITDTGLSPDIDLPLDFVPADACAAAINYISSHAEAAATTYHLASPRCALLGTLTKRLRAYGFTIKEIPYPEWVDELLRYAAGHPAHPMTPFVPLFVDRGAGSDMTVAEMYLAHTFPSYDRVNTRAALQSSGITFPPVDDGLLDLHIARLVTAGFLTDPRSAAVGGPR